VHRPKVLHLAKEDVLHRSEVALFPGAQIRCRGSVWGGPVPEHEPSAGGKNYDGSHAESRDYPPAQELDTPWEITSAIVAPSSAGLFATVTPQLRMISTFSAAVSP
jgi:hypothetical protein